MALVYLYLESVSVILQLETCRVLEIIGISLFKPETCAYFLSSGEMIEYPLVEIFFSAKAFKAISYPDMGRTLNLAVVTIWYFKLITDSLQSNELR